MLSAVLPANALMSPRNEVFNHTYHSKVSFISCLIKLALIQYNFPLKINKLLSSIQLSLSPTKGLISPDFMDKNSIICITI